VIAIATKYHPTGPIRLAGYSAAGFVAYEAARQLRRAGRDVLDVVIIGMGARSVGFRTLDAAVRRLRLPRVVRDAVLHGAMSAVNVFARLMRANVRDIRAAASRLVHALRKQPAASGVRESIEQAQAYIRYVNAHKFHIPRPYDGRVTVLWPLEQPDEIGDTRNWSRIAPLAQIAYVAGTHHVAVSRHLHQIAAAMQGAFREQPERF
jgi:thioesterase domain-containing protein